MRVKDAIDQYTINRLSEWGKWFSKGCNPGIGYASKNIIAKLREQLGDFIRGSRDPSLERNEEAEQMEELVVELHLSKPLLAEVLRIRYFYPKTHEEKAKRAGYSRSHYYHTLQRAHEWISGYFNGLKKNYKIS